MIERKATAYCNVVGVLQDDTMVCESDDCPWHDAPYRVPPAVPRLHWTDRATIRIEAWWNWVFYIKKPQGMELRVGWDVFRFMGLAALIISSVFSAAYGIDRFRSPCATDATVTGLVAGTAPDGTPAQIQKKWCVRYKPGREGETL